jgi:hypothetical protein
MSADNINLCSQESEDIVTHYRQELFKKKNSLISDTNFKQNTMSCKRNAAAFI